MRHSLPLLATGFLTLAASGLAAETLSPAQVEQVQKHVAAGDKARRDRDFAAAETEYKAATAIDGRETRALLGIGQVYMATRRFADAKASLLQCREAFAALAADAEKNAPEMEARRRSEIQSVKSELSFLRSSSTKGGGTGTAQIRVLEGRLNQLESARGKTGVPEPPAGLALAIGSAHFRLGEREDAEREYKAALQIDPKLGEAHNNLAALYLETGRADEAAREVKLAEEAGLAVHPLLKADIEKARAAGPAKSTETTAQAGEPPSAPAVERFGKPLTGMSSIQLAEVLENPSDGKPVRVEGIVAQVCKNKGCWLELKQGDQSVHVTFADYSFFVPKDCNGRKAVLEGKVRVSDPAPDEVAHLQSEGAGAAAARRVSIIATGVELGGRAE